MHLRLGFEPHYDSWKLPETATQKKKQNNPKKNKNKTKSSHKIKYPNSFRIRVLFFWTMFLSFSTPKKLGIFFFFNFFSFSVNWTYFSAFLWIFFTKCFYIKTLGE
jgi:hypothetical protein